jgi:Fe-S cluster assembly protein SufD
MEVEVAAAARFHHIRAQGRDHERRAVTHLFARLGAESLFKSFTLTANGVPDAQRGGDRAGGR